MPAGSISAADCGSGSRSPQPTLALHRDRRGHRRAPFGGDARAWTSPSRGSCSARSTREGVGEWRRHADDRRAVALAQGWTAGRPKPGARRQPRTARPSRIKAGAGDVWVGDRQGSVRNKRTFWPNSSAAWNMTLSVFSQRLAIRRAGRPPKRDTMDMARIGSVVAHGPPWSGRHRRHPSLARGLPGP